MVRKEIPVAELFSVHGSIGDVSSDGPLHLLPAAGHTQDLLVTSSDCCSPEIVPRTVAPRPPGSPGHHVLH